MRKLFLLLSLSVLVLAIAPTQADLIQCVDGLNCNGTDRADIINGTDGGDEIQGMVGNDLIFGGLSNDLIAGDEDNDIIFGGPGGDAISGNAGDDILLPGPDALGDELNTQGGPDNDVTITFAGETVFCLQIEDDGGNDSVNLIGFGPFSATVPFGIPGFGTGWIMVFDPIAGGEIWIEVSEIDDDGIETIHGLPSPNVTFQNTITGQCD